MFVCNQNKRNILNGQNNKVLLVYDYLKQLHNTGWCMKNRPAVS